MVGHVFLTVEGAHVVLIVSERKISSSCLSIVVRAFPLSTLGPRVLSSRVVKLASIFICLALNRSIKDISANLLC